MFSKNDLRRLHVFKQSLAAWGISLCALLGAQVAHAQIDYTFNNTIAQNAGIWSAVSGNSTTMGMGASGAVVPSGSLYQQLGSGANLSGWTAAGNYGVAQGATGVTVNARGLASVPGGGSVPVTLASKIKPASLAKGLTAFARALPYISWGMAIYDMGEAMGFGFDNTPAGPVVKKTDPSACMSSCYTWSITASSIDISSGSVGAMLAQIVTVTAGLDAYHKYLSCTQNGSGADAICNVAAGGVQYIFGSKTPRAPDMSAYVASNFQELEDAIAAQSGWPTTTFYTQNAVKDAINQGQSFSVEAPVLSGPASTPGETVTKQGFDSSGAPTTTVSTTTNNHTYAGNQITTTTNNVTNVTNNTTGAVTTTTTVTNQTPDPQKTDCEKDPEAVGCKHLDVPTDKVPTKEETITWAEENLGFGPGACPSPYQFSVMQTLYPKTYTIDLAQFCNTMSNVVRPLVILFSLLAAFFIVAPVTTREI